MAIPTFENMLHPRLVKAISVSHGGIVRVVHAHDA